MQLSMLLTAQRNNAYTKAHTHIHKRDEPQVNNKIRFYFNKKNQICLDDFLFVPLFISSNFFLYLS